MQKIVVTNFKGGSGKTTLTTQLAAHSVNRGVASCILDMDTQQGSIRWLRRRPHNRPTIHGLSPYQRRGNVTLSFALRIPPDTQRLIVDTPAGLEGADLAKLVRGATAVLVPVLPSSLDADAAAHCISDLLLVAKLSRQNGRIGIVANRVRHQTLAEDRLMRFIEALNIPLIATLKDTQLYVQTTGDGLGITEIRHRRAYREATQLTRIANWLDERSLNITAESALSL